ncbi:MAG: hypothetical protein HYV77_00490 [Candidatus Wildermuthbacteria bacterium]|nr:hypothetical protein [Candidatus Wildermuthbacteria bacterium]
MEGGWVLRERTSIFMSIGQRHDVGMSIKLKLYRLLLEYAFAHEVGDLDIADHEERSAREVRDALAAGDRNPNKDKTDRRSGH